MAATKCVEHRERIGHVGGILSGVGAALGVNLLLAASALAGGWVAWTTLIAWEAGISPARMGPATLAWASFLGFGFALLSAAAFVLLSAPLMLANVFGGDLAGWLVGTQLRRPSPRRGVAAFAAVVPELLVVAPLAVAPAVPFLAVSAGALVAAPALARMVPPPGWWGLAVLIWLSLYAAFFGTIVLLSSSYYLVYGFVVAVVAAALLTVLRAGSWFARYWAYVRLRDVLPGKGGPCP
ncbi:MAG: hypothetical protein AB2A00_21595 [Myxococcota bacterium]